MSVFLIFRNKKEKGKECDICDMMLSLSVSNDSLFIAFSYVYFCAGSLWVIIDLSEVHVVV